ncbi:MAG: leucine-rich repeat domain-containing protein [Bacteroidaceae bacterium]|nr:leucine-rich repeat domain-containing protein [Bacteroidaceae bacterium]
MEATVTSGDTNYTGSVTIPETVTENDVAYSVTEIGDDAFYGCYRLTSVTIPNSVTSLGNRAFSGCSGLTSVTIPNSVTSIGEGTFAACSGLTSVTIPNSVTEIRYGAFSRCSGLTSVTIPNSVTSIRNFAFYICSSLTSVTIGNSVTEIGYGAFSRCSGLTSVTIPNSVTSIRDYAFQDCSGLKDVYCCAKSVPETVSGWLGAFDNSSISSATLHVPVASLETYKATDPWNTFKEIVALTDEETAITDIEFGQSRKSHETNVIYDLQGHRISNKKLPKGVYIVNGKKVLVK